MDQVRSILTKVKGGKSDFGLADTENNSVAGFRAMAARLEWVKQQGYIGDAVVTEKTHKVTVTGGLTFAGEQFLRQDKPEAALTHVRELHQFFAELRSQNFNFFLLLLGALAAAFIGNKETAIKFGAGAGAAFICVVFFGLDARNIEMIADARRELEILEPAFSVNIHRVDSWLRFSRSRKPSWFKYNAKARYVILSHKILYRAVFAVAYLTSLLFLWNNPLVI